MVVVDACVAMSWVAPHSKSDEDYGARVSEHGRSTPHSLIAPAVMTAECSHALLRRSRRDRWSDTRLVSATDLIVRHAVRLRRNRRSVSEQVRFALDHHVQGFDSHYLALAIETGAAIATVDKGLRAAAQRAGVEVF